MSNKQLPYDKTNPASIFEYSKGLLHKTLAQVVQTGAVESLNRKGKGGLGQMVEELYFKYVPNSSPKADFEEAGVELKVTPLKLTKRDVLAIKERLVCDMINYTTIIDIPFEQSPFYEKCMLMLLLFYLHVDGIEKYDLEFLYSVLWKIQGKDLQIIQHDYEVIVNKIRRGEAHLLSEGDTMYLGACVKGATKATNLVSQYNSDIKAQKRAFSLKASYMRTILDYIQNSGTDACTNIDLQKWGTSLATTDDLQEQPFEELIIGRLKEYYGFDYLEICRKTGAKISTSKSKYNNIVKAMLGTGDTPIEETEEFKKAGITFKTIRIQKSGSIKESMSFERINYDEVYGEDRWEDSRLYEIFGGKFFFVIYREVDEKIQINGIEEDRYILDKVVFWNMPAKDLESAEEYWNNIRNNIRKDKFEPADFFQISDKKKFHVRPKARVASDTILNPQGTRQVKKYAYWFNSEYVKEIVKSAYGDNWNKIFGK